MIDRDTADPRVRQLKLHKTNIASDQTADVRYTLTGEGRDTAVSWLCDIGQETARGPAGNGQARLLLLLRNTAAPMSAQQLAARSGIACSTVRVQLSRLVKAGQVTSPSRGVFALSPAA